MKGFTLPLFLSIAIALITAPVFAAEEPTSELGKKLFINPGLGDSQNSISCNTCHPNGEGLEKAGQKSNLPQMINQCIVGPLKGQEIFEDTVAMKSLILYIKSLGK